MMTIPTKYKRYAFLGGKKLCKKYGCALNDVQQYPDALVMICEDCGQKYILNIRDGEHDKNLEVFLCRRSVIQPSDRQAWEEVYGWSKYGKMLNGESISSELTAEEQALFEKDRAEHNKAVADFEGADLDLFLSDKKKYAETL